MKKKNTLSQALLTLFFTVFCVLMILPLIILISVSFSSEQDIAQYGYRIIPKALDFGSYEYVFKNPKSIIDAYKITIIYSVLGTFTTVFAQAMIAYPLSRRNLRGRNAITFYLYFTMLFGGGLVPSYILNTQYLHLNNTIWIYILPGMVSAWGVFMMRTFFQGIPNEIIESMYIDGASEYNIFFKTILPLSKPVLATMALTTFLAKWNDWNISMLYIDKEELMSLQYLLQRIMRNIELLQQQSDIGIDISSLLSAAEIPSESARMAMAVVAAGPALVIFPFFQKYFVKGLTVGSVKG